MYLAIDIGGTKTLVASIDDTGVIQEKRRFPTLKDYRAFLGEVQSQIAQLSVKEFVVAAAGVPGTLDREHGIGLQFGTLPWQNVPIQKDLAQITNCPVLIENDAKLAGLSEAMLLKQYPKILYITVSTGIGIALIKEGEIQTDVGDAGGDAMILEHQGKMLAWEDFASGKAIVERFGKKASEITDTSTWRQISQNLAVGLIDLIGLMQPDAIVVGGGVGTYFEHYQEFLQAALKKYETAQAPIPPLFEAQRPEDAVLYGCYELAQQRHG